MGWTVSFEGDYTKKQWALLTNLSNAAVVSLPSVDPGNLTTAAKLGKPEKIMVQAKSTNQGVVVVGPKYQNDGVTLTTLPDDGSQGGFELAPGEMMVLPSRDVASWVVRGSLDGGQALRICYLAGAN